MTHRIIVFICLLLFLSSCCQTPEEKFLFSIPRKTTPLELQRLGFMVFRETRNGRTDVQGLWYNKRVQINVQYWDADTSQIGSVWLRMSEKTFSKLTGLAIREYHNILIDGVFYDVHLDGDIPMVSMYRNGLPR